MYSLKIRNEAGIIQQIDYPTENGAGLLFYPPIIPLEDMTILPPKQLARARHFT